jgi:DNA repair protein RadD
MKPRYYQQAANDAVWHYLSSTSGNPVAVLPTGAGKSLLAAMLVQQALDFDARVLVVQHRKELIQQNAEKIRLLLPDVDLGINSAGLRQHARDNDVLCCGIQTVYKKAFDFGRRELVIVDEAHLIGTDSESMYGKFLHDLKQVNPKLRVVGLTATPYRTGEGPICRPDKLFQRVCYEAFTGDLIAQGFLSPLTNKAAEATVDTSGIKMRGGEFINSDAEKAFDTSDNVKAACEEIVIKCRDRSSILVFCSGIHHAGSVAETLAAFTGEEIGTVTGDTFPMERDRILSDFRSGRMRWCVNIDVLSTGFDSPRIDAIAVLRATMSPGLFAQIVGRGLRKHEGKQDCLILDFGENIKRHGSLDDPNYGRLTGGSGGSREGTQAENNGRGKPCPNCGLDVAPRCVECPECGFVFPAKHEAQADSDSEITGKAPPQVWDVESVAWAKHQRKGDSLALPTLRIDYMCQPHGEPQGNLTATKISEWVCIEHTNFARTKACLWWQVRSSAPVPETVEDALILLDRLACRMPVQITTEKDGKWYRIKACEFVDEIPDEADWLPEREESDAVEYSGFGGDVPF